MKGAPALTVDVSASDDLDECPIPMTPANKKALQRTALHKAVIAADMSAAERALSEKPTEVHQRDEHGFTPLHNAAAQPDSRARRQLVEMLLDAGADVHAADNEGFSGLHWAAACGHADVLTLLLNAGARPEQRSASGETALHRASRLGRLNEARLLSPTHPFLPYVAPHFSHISHLNLAFQRGAAPYNGSGSSERARGQRRWRDGARRLWQGGDAGGYEESEEATAAPLRERASRRRTRTPSL